MPEDDFYLLVKKPEELLAFWTLVNISRYSLFNKKIIVWCLFSNFLSKILEASCLFVSFSS